MARAQPQRCSCSSPPSAGGADDDAGRRTRSAARSGFTALGVLNTKPRHAAIERIKAVARAFLLLLFDVFALVCRGSSSIAAWAVSVLEKTCEEQLRAGCDAIRRVHNK